MSDDDDDSLICPITQELFRDPVLAEDGRLYERAAITRWINEHGTSPFTRQVLDVNRLQPDLELRKRAEQRRRLSVSYNRASDRIQLPPVRPPPNIRFNNRINVITPPPEPIRRRTRCLSGCGTCCSWVLLLTVFICIAFYTIGPVLIGLILYFAIPKSQDSSFTTTTPSPVCSRLYYSM